MGKNKKKKKQLHQQQGRGRGRGQGRGRGDTRSPFEYQGPGIVRKNQHEKTRTVTVGRGSGRGGRKFGSCVPQLAQVVEEVREDGFLRHQEVQQAHTDAIMAVVMAADAIYTASRDKKLKRWKVGRSPLNNRFELKADLEVPLSDTCHCMVLIGDWIFCGLGNGTVRGFHKEGREALLAGHQKRATVLLVHQHVLLSGSQDATIRCWQQDPATQNFATTHTVSEGIPGGVSAAVALGEHLWVGGSSGVGIVELASLRVVHHVLPKKFVAGLLPFEGHMIVAYADGALAIFDPAGVQKHSQQPLPAGPILSMCGLESGPRVIVGHAKGQVSSIALPMFQMRKYWQALSRHKVNCLFGAGHDGIFLLGGENGHLQLWQRDDAADI